MSEAKRSEPSGGPGRVVALLVATLTLAPIPGSAQAEPPGERGSIADPAASPLVPDTVIAPPGRPRIVVLDGGLRPTLSLRLSLPLVEAPSEAGAGRLLVRLGVARARSMAARIGARVEGDRTPWGIAYTVTGSTDDIDYLAYLLRLAVREPDPTTVEFDRARSALLERARRGEETASGTLATSLRTQAAPATPPLGGTTASLARLTPRHLHDLWSRSHAASAMTVVVTAPLPAEVLLVSVQGMGASGETAPAPPDDAAPTVRPNRTQVLRSWYGEVHLTSDPDDPRAEVAAVLAAGELRGAGGGYEAHVEVWHLRRAKALAVIGAAYDRDRRRMRTDVGAVLDRTAASLTPAGIEEAVADVRRRTLFRARTPWGLADVVGVHLDATGQPDAALTYLSALDALTVEGMRGFLRELAERTPLRAEVTG